MMLTPSAVVKVRRLNIGFLPGRAGAEIIGSNHVPSIYWKAGSLWPRACHSARSLVPRSESADPAEAVRALAFCTPDERGKHQAHAADCDGHHGRREHNA